MFSTNRRWVIKCVFCALLLAAMGILFCACFSLYEFSEPDEFPTDALRLSWNYAEVEKGTTLEEALADLEIREGGARLSLSDVSIEGTYDPLVRGEYALTISHGEKRAEVRVFVEAEGVEENARFQTLDELAEDLGLAVGIPSEGEVNLLVIPIGFSDRSYDGVRETLEIAFNGTEEETGWHSLRSYYAASSFGKLDLRATILPTYQTGTRWKPRERTAVDQEYLTKAIAYFDDRIDYKKYDANEDGRIDCVYMIYLAPYVEDSDLWWAYESEIDPPFWAYDGVRPSSYLWMSFEFFSDPIFYLFGEESDLGVSVNAETLIHETGHALGLDDYYDYINEETPYGGLGGLNMMDGNQGDHDPFSKAILGWIEPTFVYRTDYEAELSPFEETGDALIISKQGKNSYFQEYFIVCYYTPTGLFELKSEKECGILSAPGVLIYHVNAGLKSARRIGRLVEIYRMNNGKDPRLIRICEADDDDSVDSSYYAEDDDLFLAGDTFSPAWSDGTPAGFALTIGSIGDRAKVSVVFEG